MWLLHFLPDSFLLWVVNMVLIAGAVGTFVAFFLINRLLRWFPSLAPYHLLLQIVSIALLVAGLYWKGGYSVEMEWRAKVAELEAKVAAAEAKSKETNVEIQTKVVTKIKKIKDVQVQIQKEIVEKEKIINAECTVPKDAVTLLNKAAEAPKEKKAFGEEIK